ncbi:glycosyltransferase [Pseudoduganella eburnea]|uniref:Glycosyltransferase n=1 Tax=Massilia eburnea TaxID=1776165 RepID=A0A6L6QGB6_9BURK|nr:glycosyltransferase [Massilia eburnea]MTW10703.1 glycosyltransferase [Massilia eburnea]
MARPVRILQLVPEPLPTFRADVATLFGKYLPRHGVQCHVVGKGSAAPADDQGFASSRRASAGARWRAELSFLWLCLRALLGANRRSHDAVQVRDMVSIGLLALLVARIKGLPMVYWLSYLMSEGRIERGRAGLARQSGWRSLRARLVLGKGLVERWLLYRVLLPRADHVFVQSEAMARLVAQHGVAAERISAVPMGVDMEAVLRPDARPSARRWSGWEGRPVVAYLGTLDRARCLERLLDALLLVRQELPGTSLLLIGSAPQQDDVALLLAAARERGLDDAVQVTGWLPPAQAWQYLLGAQAAVSYVPRGALYDVSSPTKLLEYLALGMPCVGNDIPDQEAVLAASGAGWLAASTPQAMADALLAILRDPQAARRRAAAGPAYIESARSYRVLGAALAARYRTLVGDDHAGRIA